MTFNVFAVRLRENANITKLWIFPLQQEELSVVLVSMEGFFYLKMLGRGSEKKPTSFMVFYLFLEGWWKMYIVRLTLVSNREDRSWKALVKPRLGFYSPSAFLQAYYSHVLCYIEPYTWNMTGNDLLAEAKIYYNKFVYTGIFFLQTAVIS